MKLFANNSYSVVVEKKHRCMDVLSGSWHVHLGRQTKYGWHLNEGMSSAMQLAPWRRHEICRSSPSAVVEPCSVTSRLATRDTMHGQLTPRVDQISWMHGQKSFNPSGAPEITDAQCACGKLGRNSCRNVGEGANKKTKKMKATPQEALFEQNPSPGRTGTPT